MEFNNGYVTVSAKIDEDLLIENGWYSVDHRAMVWVNPEDGSRMDRSEALRLLKDEYVDEYPGMT